MGEPASEAPPAPPTSGVTIAEHAIQPSVTVNPAPASNGAIAKINVIIVKCLAYSLGGFVGCLVLLGLLSWWDAAGDPVGTNALREDIKTFVTFILGIFAGVIQAKVIGRHES